MLDIVSICNLQLTFTHVIGSLVAFLLIYRWYRRPKNFPPGPRGIPVLGALPWAGSYPKKAFAEWSKKYGPVMSVRMGSKDWIVLNNYEAIHEAIVEKKDQFSGRPKIPAYEQLTQGCGIAFIDYGSLWKSQRKFGLKTLFGFGVGKKSIEERVREEVEYVNRVIKKHDGKPFDILMAVNNAHSNNICNVLFGKRFDYSDKRFADLVRLVDKGVFESEDKTMVIMLALVPCLVYFPPFRQMNQRLLDDSRSLLDHIREIVDDHKKTFDQEHPRDFIDAYIAEINKNEDGLFTENQLLHYVRDLFFAGKSAPSVIRWGILCLLHHPEIQEKVYNEVRTVVGTEATVTMSHKADMPYTSAFIEELYRFFTAVPLNVPHNTTEDVTLYGFDIPKGVKVASNLWAVHNDSRFFDEPEKFKPERFLDNEGKFVKSKYVIPFSIGPRQCLGGHLARTEIFILLVSLVQKFELQGSGIGDEKLPDMHEGLSGPIFAPLPFNVVATER